MQARVRDSYRRQAAADHWAVIDGERAREAIAADVIGAVTPLLAWP